MFDALVSPAGERGGHSGPLSAHVRPGRIASLLGVDRKTVRRWIHRELLPAVQLPNGQYRIDPAQVSRRLTPVGGATTVQLQFSLYSEDHGHALPV